MSMTNREVCLRFANKKVLRANYEYIKNGKGTLFVDCYKKNYVLLSYGTHYPLCWFVGGLPVVNTKGYSSTTRRHINLIRSVLGVHETCRIMGNDFDSMEEAACQAWKREQGHMLNKLESLEGKTSRSPENKAAYATSMIERITHLSDLMSAHDPERIAA